MPEESRLAHDLYEKLFNEEDARACKAIDEKACKVVPGNFILILLSQFLTQLGDALVNPKVILPWVMNVVGAPLFMTGLLVPIREAGALIPQLVIASFVRRIAVRKWVWITGSIGCAITVMGFGLTAWKLDGAVAGWTLIGLLVIFSLARGLTSVASKDVTGKTIPKSRRGRLSGWSASTAGLVTLGVGVLLLSGGNDELNPKTFTFLLGSAAAMWVIASITFARVVEYPGETDGGRNGMLEALKRLDLLRTDARFRRFVLTRALMLATALVAPFYVVLAQNSLGSPGYLLGLFIIASGAAGLVSGPFWGKMADLSSRQVMILSATLASTVGIVVFAIAKLQPEWLHQSWLLPLAYFALNIAHQGVRVGRKTYLVDMADGNRRTDYVAVSNTVIGVLLLITGIIGTLSSVIGISGVILVLSLMALAGSALALTLDEVE